jgi:hypothetical protein
MLIWLSTLPKPRAALGSASPSRSLSIVSRLYRTWCRIGNHHCSRLNCRRGPQSQPAISTSFPAFAPSFAASSNWSPVLASLSTTPAARRHFRSPKTNMDS